MINVPRDSKSQAYGCSVGGRIIVQARFDLFERTLPSSGLPLKRPGLNRLPGVPGAIREDRLDYRRSPKVAKAGRRPPIFLEVTDGSGRYFLNGGYL